MHSLHEMWLAKEAKMKKHTTLFMQRTNFMGKFSLNAIENTALHLAIRLQQVEEQGAKGVVLSSKPLQFMRNLAKSVLFMSSVRKSVLAIKIKG